MTEVILNIATSQDGFIADSEGGVDWLPPVSPREDYGIYDFCDSVDAIVMGKHAYQLIASFGDWSWPGKPAYVFTKSELPSLYEEVEFVTSDVETFLQRMEEKGIKRLWLLGGSALAESFYKAGKIDGYIFTVVPAKVGEGIALKPSVETIEKDPAFKLTLKHYADGVVQKQFFKV